jgi:putative ABC transport system substrate-binding protein
MRRRDFITLLGGAAAAWPLAARAQQAAVPVIGALITPSPSEYVSRVEDFRRGLAETGFVEGRNVAIEYRYADNQLDRLPAFITDLVSRKVAAIYVTGDSVVAVPMLKMATQTIPIVFTTGSDPVAGGMVASLNRPGGNVTGATNLTTELGPKHLELLHELVPTASRVGLLVNPNNPAGTKGVLQMMQPAAGRLGLDIAVIEAGTVEAIDQAFESVARQRIAALVLGQDAFFNARSEQIAALALRYRLPTVSATRSGAEAGALISYGGVESTSRQAGVYVGRILKGDKPADLPVLQPTKFELVINLKTAKALGLTVPYSMQLLADEVIE